jgi:organic radical activating enzyme
MKFKYLKVDLESQTTYTCHAAQPHKIDFSWLSANKGNLFNHAVNVKERTMMLSNRRAPSCEQNCWHAEDQQQTSPRLYQQGHVRTHSNIVTAPETIDITVGPDCNLTCSYCCKEFSTAWRRDIEHNGEYDLSPNEKPRYQLTQKDRLLMKVSQPKLYESSRYRLLLEEIRSMSSTVKSVDITGGEPFLNNKLLDIIESCDLPQDSTIIIYTGLGVDSDRFGRMIEKLRDNHRVKIKVSAEGIGKHLEFNRYGIAWPKFQENLHILKHNEIDFWFHSTLTNLTAFGFRDFYQFFQDRDITLTFAYQPRMQSLHVIDPASKQTLHQEFELLPEHLRMPLQQTMRPDPSKVERSDMAKFLSAFAARRPDIDLSIYPKSFLTWLGI